MASVNEDERARLISDALAAADQPSAERPRIPWKSGFHISPIVELRVDSVLLNPRSHRIRSQLESHPSRELVLSEPYGETAQLVIERLLRATEGYDALRQNLKEAGQREFGIATHRGLLVNANTRCVALRDNGTEYLRVAILPSDAQQKEIDALELRLQLQEDFRQPYSFSNQLLFVDELLRTYGHTDERVALDMNWASSSDPGSLKEGVKEVQRHLRMLAIMRDLQTVSGGRLPLTWLDEDRRQAMIDLDAEIEKLARKDDASADLLKQSRLVGMLVGAFYRDLREIDQAFARKYLLPYLEEKPSFAGRLDTLLAPPPQSPPTLKGLDAFEPVAAAALPHRLDLAPLVSKLAESHGQATIAWKDSDGDDTLEERAPIVAELLEAVTTATDDARIDRKNGTATDRPRRLLEQAAKFIHRATESFLDVQHLSEFKRAPFDGARADLSAEMAALTKAVEQPS